MHRWLKFLLATFLVLFISFLALTSPPAQGAPTAYNPNELSCGIYWFGFNGANQKFISGEVNPYFDPARPTLIYVHGWQPFLSSNLPNFDYSGVDTAAAWIDNGWNVGIFIWNQFSDETTGVFQGGNWFSGGTAPEGVTDAEAKVWTPNGPKRMRWRDWDDLPPLGDGYSEAPPGTPSAAELFYQEYVAAMIEYEYTGGNIRIAGHSLGNQMAVRLTKLVSDAIAAGNVPEHLRPTRVALLDPYWSPDARNYLGDKTVGETIRGIITELLPTGTLFEWYWSSDWTTPPEGDANDALKPMTLYAEMNPAHEANNRDKHMAAKYLYFWSYAFAGPPECSGDACLSNAKMLSKMSDARLAALMRSDYTWAQNEGALSATPDDDIYRSGVRADAPYTITQLLANPITQTVGGTITLTAMVEDKNNTPADDGTLVAFGTALGTGSPRSATNGGAATAHITSDTAGVAQVTATTRGTGGTAQSTAIVTFCIQADFDCDCDVDTPDLQMAADHWLCALGDGCYNSRFDRDSDNDVDIVDVMMTAAQWGWQCD